MGKAKNVLRYTHTYVHVHVCMKWKCQFTLAVKLKQHEFPQAETTHHGLYRMFQGGWQAAPGQTFYVKKEVSTTELWKD